MKEQLSNIYITLEQIEVKGFNNINYMCGVLNSLKKIIEEMEE